MRNVKIKTAGHFIEKEVFRQLEDMVSGTPCDITDVEMYLPSLKGGIGMKYPSIVSFTLIAQRIHVDVYYEKIMEILTNNGCNVLYTNISEY